MSTTAQTQTLTVMVLDVDGTLSSQTLDVDPTRDPLSTVRAALGPRTLSAELVCEAFDLTAWADEDGFANELAPNPVGAMVVGLLRGFSAPLVGRVVFTASTEDGTLTDPTAQQATLLASHIDGARALFDLLGAPSIIVG